MKHVPEMIILSVDNLHIMQVKVLVKYTVYVHTYLQHFAEKTWHYICEHSQMAHEASSMVHDNLRIAHECIKQTEINDVLS